MKDEPENESYSDEIKREDGLERYWLFYNGQWAETIFGLAAAGGGVFWCFLYILGYSQTIVGYILGAIAVLGFISWYFFLKRIQIYEQSGWRVQRKDSTGAEKRKLYVALGLWTFLLLFFGLPILLQNKSVR